MNPGQFITLEGTEGVGKTTNLAVVVDAVRSSGFTVVETREPGGTLLAEQIRDILLGIREEAMSDVTELLLIFAARSQHVNSVIGPALQRGCWVVCDRFTDATYAYQGGGRGIDSAVISGLEQLVQGDLRPDLTIYLDVPVEVAAARIAEREHDRFEREQQQFFERVRSTYLELARTQSRYRVIDASRPLEEVQAAVREAVRKFLNGVAG